MVHAPRHAQPPLGQGRTTSGSRPRDAVAQTASQCFDISVWQFLAAAAGRRPVHVFPRRGGADPAAPARTQAARRRDHDPGDRAVAPARWPRRGSTPRDRAPAARRLRWMIPPARPCRRISCRAWLALYPGVPLLNAYGPTECSDDVTHRVIRDAPGRRAATSDRPADPEHCGSTSSTPALQPVPAGVPGELFVGGAGLGRGYLQDGRRARPQTFVPDPFAAGRARGCTAPATWCAGAPDGSSSSSAASTTRSRSAASASSPARSRRR